MKLGIVTSKELTGLTADDQLFLKELKPLEHMPIVWSECADSELQSCQALLIRSPWDYHHHLNSFIQFLERAEALGVKVYNSSQLVRWNSDKVYLADLQQKAVDIVPSLFFTDMNSFESSLQKAKSLGWSELILKPTISATSHLTFKTPWQSSENKAYAAQILQRSRGVIQPFLSSVASEGEVSLIFFNTPQGPEFSHGVLKRPKDKDFRVQVDFGGTSEAFKASETLIQAGQKVLAPVSDWLYARVDLVNWSTVPLLGELEIIEPCLFFEQASQQALRFAEILKARLL